MKVEKKKRAKAPVKRRSEVRVIAQPMPINPTPSAEPNHTVVNTMVITQMPVAKSMATAATSMHVTVYNLVQGKFKESPKRKKVLLPPTVTPLRKDSNQKLQPHRTGKIPYGLILYQLPQTCLM